MAILIDSLGEYTQVGSAHDTNAAYTIAVWVRFNAMTSGYNYYVTGSYLSTDSPTYRNADWIQAIGASAKIQVAAFINNTNGTITLTSGTFAINTWYHMALVRASTTSLALYVNGVDSGASCVTNVAGRTASNRIMLGNVPWQLGNQYQLNGRLAHAKVWTAALTADELKSEMLTVRPQRLANLWAWYPMLGAGAAERDRDYSGNARTLTEAVTPANADDPGITWGGRIWVVGQLGAPVYEQSLTLAVDAVTTQATQADLLRSLPLTADAAVTRSAQASLIRTLTLLADAAALLSRLTPLDGSLSLSAVAHLADAGMAAPPIAGYSFDAQNLTDDIGTADFSYFNDEPTYDGSDKKHGAYSVGSITSYLGMSTNGLTDYGQEFTFALWVKFNSGTGVDFYLNGNSLHAAWLPSVFTLAWQSTSLIFRSGSWSTSEWHLLIFGHRSDGYFFVSIDGETIVDSTITQEISNSGVLDMFLSPNVRVDTVAFWTVALTQADVDFLYNGGTGRNIAELLVVPSGLISGTLTVARTLALFADASVARTAQVSLLRSLTLLADATVTHSGTLTVARTLALVADAAVVRTAQADLTRSLQLLTSAAQASSHTLTVESLLTLVADTAALLSGIAPFTSYLNLVAAVHLVDYKIPTPVHGYSFEEPTSETSADNIGSNDLISNGLQYTASSKHGAAALGNSSGYFYNSQEVSHSRPWSTAAWIYVPAGVAWGMQEYSSTWSDVLLSLSFDDTYCQVYDGGASSAFSSVVPTANAWNLFAYGMNADGYLWVSVNGGEIATSLEQSAFLDTPRALYSADTLPAGVRFDTYAVWAAGLNQSDIDWLYNDGAGYSIADLLVTPPGMSAQLEATRLLPLIADAITEQALQADFAGSLILVSDALQALSNSYTYTNLLELLVVVGGAQTALQDALLSVNLTADTVDTQSGTLTIARTLELLAEAGVSLSAQTDFIQSMIFVAQVQIASSALQDALLTLDLLAAAWQEVSTAINVIIERSLLLSSESSLISESIATSLVSVPLLASAALEYSSLLAAAADLLLAANADVTSATQADFAPSLTLLADAQLVKQAQLDAQNTIELPVQVSIVSSRGDITYVSGTLLLSADSSIALSGFEELTTNLVLQANVAQVLTALQNANVTVQLNVSAGIVSRISALETDVTLHLETSAIIGESGRLNAAATTVLAAQVTQAIASQLAAKAGIPLSAAVTLIEATMLEAVGRAVLNAAANISDSVAVEIFTELGLIANAAFSGEAIIYIDVATSDDNMFHVEFEVRVFSVENETRVFRVGAETRVFNVEGETRLFPVSAETRMFAVPGRLSSKIID